VLLMQASCWQYWQQLALLLHMCLSMTVGQSRHCMQLLREDPQRLTWPWLIVTSWAMVFLATVKKVSGLALVSLAVSSSCPNLNLHGCDNCHS